MSSTGLRNLGLRPGLVAAFAATLALSLPAQAAASDVFVADPGSDRVVRVSDSTGSQQQVSAGGSLVNPMGIAVAADGGLIVAVADAFGGNGGVIRVDPATGAQSTVSSGGSFKDPTGVAIAANGDVLVADSGAFGGNGGVIRVDPATGAQSTLSSGGSFKDPTGVAIAANGDVLVADPYGSGAVTRVDPANGAQSPIASGSPLADPAGIAVDAAGTIFVADPAAVAVTGGVIGIDPGSGAMAVVSGGGLFVDPTGLAARGGVLLVADQNAWSGVGAILRVNPVTGGQFTLTLANLLSDPYGVAFPPDGDSDTVPDYSDNCPAAANPGQEDRDGDALGDACDAVDDRPSPPGRDVPPPVLGRSVNAGPVSGVVRVSVPGAAGGSWSVLTATRQIPVGSSIDTTRGRVRLETASRTAGVTQAAVFRAGRFRVAQRSRDRGLTELRLTGRLPRCQAAGARASAASARQPRRLWGNGKGRFRTRGRRSSATVRGTKWLVEDRCDGTLTRVARGTVGVRDLVRRRTVTVRAGHRYLARNPKG